MIRGGWASNLWNNSNSDTAHIVNLFNRTLLYTWYIIVHTAGIYCMLVTTYTIASIDLMEFKLRRHAYYIQYSTLKTTPPLRRSSKLVPSTTNGEIANAAEQRAYANVSSGAQEFYGNFPRHLCRALGLEFIGSENHRTHGVCYLGCCKDGTWWKAGGVKGQVPHIRDSRYRSKVDNLDPIFAVMICCA